MNIHNRQIELGLGENPSRFPVLKVRQPGPYPAESIDIQMDLHPIMLQASTVTCNSVWEMIVDAWNTDPPVVYFYMRKVVRYVQCDHSTDKKYY